MYLCLLLVYNVSVSGYRGTIVHPGRRTLLISGTVLLACLLFFFLFFEIESCHIVQAGLEFNV